MDAGNKKLREVVVLVTEFRVSLKICMHKIRIKLFILVITTSSKILRVKLLNVIKYTK